jgi:hypothetical protein
MIIMTQHEYFSDEENKENYTPPTVYSPTAEIDVNHIKQEVNKQ